MITNLFELLQDVLYTEKCIDEYTITSVKDKEFRIVFIGNDYFKSNSRVTIGVIEFDFNQKCWVITHSILRYHCEIEKIKKKLMLEE